MPSQETEMFGLTSKLTARIALALLCAAVGGSGAIEARQAPTTSAGVTADQVDQAVTAISQAKGYSELVTALAQHKNVLGSQRARALMNERLRLIPPDDQNGRRLLQILGQLFADTGQESAETAAGRYLVRLIAVGAMMTGDSDQLQRLLFRYYEFSPKVTVEMIKPSLETPAIEWPPALPKLMAQFVEDWHGMGANEAARSFADALHAAIDDPTGEIAKSRDEALVGQWYSTQRGISAEPEDTNLILTKSGVARTYVSTGGPQDFEGIEAGRWMNTDGRLVIKWDDGRITSAPYQLSNGQLQWSALGAKIWIRR
jgi:hypothetical protein